MLQCCRLALQDELSGGNLGGEVEIDETFIGGKARNMHKQDKIRKMRGKRGSGDAGNKTVVMGMLERGKHGSKVGASVIPDRSKAIMKPLIEGTLYRVNIRFRNQNEWFHLGLICNRTEVHEVKTA
ncbi:MAG TPA: transposase [Bryobacteraceae bacterium]|nr:transposase [Bryobacteraceae bacterium]